MGLPAIHNAFYAGVCFILYTTWTGFAAFWRGGRADVRRCRGVGFGMAFPAVFLVLLRGMWKGFKAARPWFVSLIVACGTYLSVDGHWYVPMGAMSGLLAAYIWGEKE